MSIVRTVEWALTCPPGEADALFRKALGSLGMRPQGPMGALAGSAKRSLAKNRWSAEVYLTIESAPQGSMVRCRVEMPAGTKHFEVAGDLAEAVGDGFFDDRGVAEAVARLGRGSRLFGRKEIRHLRNLLLSTERVAELGQGQFGDKQGLVILTNERLFFFEKSLGSETVEQFELGGISSTAVNKSMSGETLQIYASGNRAEIKSMGHGQADALASALRSRVKRQPVSTSPVQNPISQLEALAVLHDKGVLSSDEFSMKKAQILDRM